MDFSCRHEDKNGERCDLAALPGREYCRWHLIARPAHRASETSGGRILGCLHIFLGVFLVGLAFSKLVEFLLTAEARDLYLVCLSASMSGLCISYGAMLLGSSRTLWPKLCAVSLPASSLLLLGGGVAVAVAPSAAKVFTSELLLRLQAPHPLFVAAIVAAWGTYGALTFLEAVLLLRVPRWAHLLVTGAFVLVVAAFVVLDKAPLGQMVYVLFLVGLFLEIKYHWLKKLWALVRGF